ncbi:hypothetical protein FA15DRAFT_664537 [Coprinopsis marcescibilis]|uniref:DUF6534 domain-containing protein n=1 Tax=Coprinopsis marcescibilis TaxID=230819 RepID=A0A5C3L8W9_COPMA|nr:hypothetical protein FA15DRAFT_664537 [Coprinopsis marcescibilis]
MDDVGTTLGAAFYGFTIGAVLFGITITQTYQYFMSKRYGHVWQQYVIVIILLLDTLHFGFAVHLMYTYLLALLGHPVIENAVWSLKSMGSVQVLFTVFVQGLYLYKIWAFAENPMLTPRFGRGLRAIVLFFSLIAIGVGILFLIELQKVAVIRSFDLRFEYVIYVGFGATAFIDMGIAAAMCLMLHKGGAGTKRSNKIIITLIQYIVGTGLLTSLGALLIMVLYIGWPQSLLYLGVEYSMTRLYAISVLALYNSQARLRERLNETRDLHGASMLYFAEPEKIICHPGQTVSHDEHLHNGHHHRSETLDTLDTPDSRRYLNNFTRNFENADAEDTLVERSQRSPAPATRSGRNGRHSTV